MSHLRSEPEVRPISAPAGNGTPQARLLPHPDMKSKANKRYGSEYAEQAKESPAAAADRDSTLHAQQRAGN